MTLERDVGAMIAAARAGDRRALARIITQVEERLPDGAAALALLFPSGGRSWTTGITGAPGAGKSTLTGAMVAALRERETEVAVVAVDPSSPFTGGAILGDRIRMQHFIDDHGVYIRSMASRGNLGGIASTTPRVLTILDGIGFPEVIVETVGVGQAEVEIASAADTTIVVVNPRWGDSVQAAKAGLLEIGDVFVVNKADRPGSEDTIRDLRLMLELGGKRDWVPPIVETVATELTGIAEVWRAVDDHRAYLLEAGRLEVLRDRRAESMMEEAVRDELRVRLQAVRNSDRWQELVGRVVERTIDPWSASEALLAGGPQR